MKKITLIQKIAGLEEFYQMRNALELPLIVSLTDDEIELLKSASDTQLLGLDSLYYGTHFRDKDGSLCMFLQSDALRELIESKKVCVLEFIDLNGETKYVDYIAKSYSVDCTDVVVFRDKKRVFGGMQARYSLNKNQRKVTFVSMNIGNASGLVPMIHSNVGNDSEREEALILCTEILDQQKKVVPPVKTIK